MRKTVYEDATFEDRFLRLPEVRNRVGFSRATIYRLMESGDFPAPVHLGARAVGWLQSEISAWIANRAKESGKLVVAA